MLSSTLTGESEGVLHAVKKKSSRRGKICIKIPLERVKAIIPKRAKNVLQRCVAELFSDSIRQTSTIWLHIKKYYNKRLRVDVIPF